MRERTFGGALRAGSGVDLDGARRRSARPSHTPMVGSAARLAGTPGFSGIPEATIGRWPQLPRNQRVGPGPHPRGWASLPGGKDPAGSSWHRARPWRGGRRSRAKISARSSRQRSLRDQIRRSPNDFGGKRTTGGQLSGGASGCRQGKLPSRPPLGEAPEMPAGTRFGNAPSSPKTAPMKDGRRRAIRHFGWTAAPGSAASRAGGAPGRLAIMNPGKPAAGSGRSAGRHERMDRREDVKERKPRRRDDLVWREVDREVVVLDETGTLLTRLNPTGAFIWRCADGNRTVEQIARLLADHFDVSPVRALEDVESFCRQLEEAGLLEPPPRDD
ncbi:MAG: PqqD family protein [Acidobacteria bacterium]|nr:MAG: PqqD family protein [Acidobacteriota bacterium]